MSPSSDYVAMTFEFKVAYLPANKVVQDKENFIIYNWNNIFNIFLINNSYN